jgi:Tfp pilus assembly protein PilF
MADAAGRGQNAEALTASGVAWLKKNDLVRAIADFTRAIRLDAKNAKAYRTRQAPEVPSFAPYP